MSGQYMGASAFKNAAIFLQSAIVFADLNINERGHRVRWCQCHADNFRIHLTINKSRFIQDVQHHFAEKFTEEAFCNVRDNLGARSRSREHHNHQKFLDILTWTNGHPPSRGRRPTDLMLTFPTGIHTRDELEKLEWLIPLWNQARVARHLSELNYYQHLYEMIWHFYKSDFFTKKHIVNFAKS